MSDVTVILQGIAQNEAGATEKLLPLVLPEQARVVVLKFFGGMTNLEVAETLGVGERTVDRQWACAKARLFRWLRKA